MQKLKIESQEDSWRLKCQNGHQVTPTNEHWYCHRCARWGDEDVEPELEYAIDEKTGKELRREDVQLNWDAPGVYHA